jgi:hypothetical protein
MATLGLTTSVCPVAISNQLQVTSVDCRTGKSFILETKIVMEMSAYKIVIKTTPWPLVRKRTIPTERPPLVGEVSANFLRIEGVAWSAQRISRPLMRFS